MNLQQDLSVNRTLFNNGIKGIKTGASTICMFYNFCSPMEKSYYVFILLKTSKGTAKTIHKSDRSITM